MDFIEVLTLILVLNLDRNEGITEADSKPIHLTDFIEKGEIIKARQLSLVTHDVIPKSHAGLITVDKQHGNHLFFWFFPAMNSDPQSPLLVWLNGGPGVSSMVGLFHENGPIRIESAEGENVTYKRREKSWAEKFNMLYIDQPVGVGYSYTEDEQGGYRVAQEGYSKDLYEFMEQFYVLFSEYKRRDLYIGGQSYAGKYVPAFAYHVHTKIMANTSSIPLKGIYLGGPLFDPQTQCREATTLYEALGVLSKKETEDFVKKFDNFVSNGNYSHLKTQEYFDTIFPPVYMYYHDNYLTLETAPYAKISKIMTSEEVRKLIHVGNLSYESWSSDVNEKFRQDMMIGTKSKLAILMDRYKVCLFNGDLDGIVSSQMVDAGLMSMAWSRQAEYNSSNRQIWGLDTKPKGYYTKAGQFCRVVIRKAGHQVPYDQPEITLEMMEMFVQNGCVQN